jgi:aryl-alcohol dehydrogenase-like predicted oxidoreductase
VIATKFARNMDSAKSGDMSTVGPVDGSADHVRRSIEGSLNPIPGTKRRTYLEQNAGAADVQLSEEDLRRIEAELPAVSGDRYDEAGMAAVNL